MPDEWICGNCGTPLDRPEPGCWQCAAGRRNRRQAGGPDRTAIAAVLLLAPVVGLALAGGACAITVERGSDPGTVAFGTLFAGVAGLLACIGLAIAMFAAGWRR